MSAQSNVGNSAIYEAGDQRNVPASQVEGRPRHHEGQTNSHSPNDPKDQRSIANRLDREERRTDPADDRETEASKRDPTLPAQLHGNEPSKGAKVDADIQAEEEEILKKKGAK